MDIRIDRRFAISYTTHFSTKQQTELINVFWRHAASQNYSLGLSKPVQLLFETFQNISRFDLQLWKNKTSLKPPLSLNKHAPPCQFFRCILPNYIFPSFHHLPSPQPRGHVNHVHAARVTDSQAISHAVRIRLSEMAISDKAQKSASYAVRNGHF